MFQGTNSLENEYSSIHPATLHLPKPCSGYVLDPGAGQLVPLPTRTMPTCSVVTMIDIDIAIAIISNIV